MRYQVVYNKDNKTVYSDMEAISYNNILAFFDKVVGANVVEIREYDYESSDKKISNIDLLQKNFCFKAYTKENNYIDIKIPLIKKSFEEDKVVQFIKENLKIDNKKIQKITFKITK